MSWKLSTRAERMSPSFIREILKVGETPGMISLAGGMPSPKTFPVSVFEEACAKVLAQDGQAALQYSATEGFAPLREAVTHLLPWNVDPSRVLITTGAQQGLDLVAKILTNPGGPVLVEKPTFLGALQAFESLEANPVGVNCDDDGVQIRDMLEKAAGAPFIYLLPNFQNPTGRTMSEERRAAVVAEAEKAGLPIVEDNPYGELWYDKAPPLPLTARNPDGCIYLGSFSKVLTPGLRLGYIVAPDEVYSKLVQAKQAADVHSSNFNQRLVWEVIKDGFLDRHVPTIRSLYKRQRDVMLAALKEEMDGLGVQFNVPEGGMFIWVRLPEGLDAVELLPRAVERNVTYVPGAAFFVESGDPRRLRLSFVSVSEDQIKVAIRELAVVVREAISKKG